MSRIDSSQSIKDSFHLGKFRAQQKQPRPILVKLQMCRAFSQCWNAFVSPIHIKADMSPEERQSSLLRERWRLIQSGVLQSAIKVGGSYLYVNHKVYGEYNSTTCSFEQHSSSIVLIPNSIQSSNIQPQRCQPFVKEKSEMHLENE